LIWLASGQGTSIGWDDRTASSERAAIKWVVKNSCKVERKRGKRGKRARKNVNESKAANDTTTTTRLTLRTLNSGKILSGMMTSPCKVANASFNQSTSHHFGLFNTFDIEIVISAPLSSPPFPP
jgi:hypothetical protein